MSVVIDVIASSSGHIHRIAQEKDCINDRRHRYEKYADRLPGPDQDKGKKHCGNRSRCAKASVIVIVPVFEVTGNIRYDQGADIQRQVIIPGQAKHLHIIGFHDPAEKIQGDHVEEKMNIIGMDQSAGDEPVILSSVIDGRWPENQIVDDLGIAEARYGNDAGYCDDAYR